MPDECYVIEDSGNAEDKSPSVQLLELLARDDLGHMIVLGDGAEKTYGWCCDLVEGGKFRVSAVWVKDAESVRNILAELSTKPGVEYEHGETKLLAVDPTNMVTKALNATRARSLFRVNGAYLSIFRLVVII